MWKKIFLLNLFLVPTLLLLEMTQAADTIKDPVSNPICWKKEDCAKARAIFLGSKQWLDLTVKEQAELAGGFVPDPATCGPSEDWGKCLPGNLTETSISFGGQSRFTHIGDFIQQNYNYAIIVAGVLAALMIVFAGFQWVASGGNSETINSAKKRIGGAVIGLFIVYTSYLILNTINPATVNLRLPQTWLVRGQGFDVTVEKCDPEEGSVSRKACEAKGKTCFSTSYGKAGACQKLAAGAVFVPAIIAATPVAAIGSSIASGVTAAGSAIAAAPGVISAAITGASALKIGGVVLVGATVATEEIGLQKKFGYSAGEFAVDTASAGIGVVWTGIKKSADFVLNGPHDGICIDSGENTKNLVPGSMCNPDVKDQCGDGGRCLIDEDVTALLSCWIAGAKVGYCSSGKSGSYCKSNTDCKEGLKCLKDSSLMDITVCSDGSEGSSCSSNSDCNGNLQCNRSRCVTSVKGTQQPCKFQGECSNAAEQCIYVTNCGQYFGYAGIWNDAEDHQGKDYFGSLWDARTWSGDTNGAIGFCMHVDDIKNNMSILRKKYQDYGMFYCMVIARSSDDKGACQLCYNVDGSVIRKIGDVVP